MSCKSMLTNSIKSASSEYQQQQQEYHQQWLKTQPSESNVKFAGEEAKDRLYEPKHKKKLVRVLTVVAYVFTVSLAAIMLSLYYVFIWNPNTKLKTYAATDALGRTKCIQNVLVDEIVQTSANDTLYD